MATDPHHYGAAVALLKSDPSARLLDLACAVGQVLRALVHNEGVDPRQLAGTDLRWRFMELGYELFRDGPPASSSENSETAAPPPPDGDAPPVLPELDLDAGGLGGLGLPSPLRWTSSPRSPQLPPPPPTQQGDAPPPIPSSQPYTDDDKAWRDKERTWPLPRPLAAEMRAGDLLAAPGPDGRGDPALTPLDGQFAVVHAQSFFHLFGWDQQVRAAVRIVKFLRPPQSATATEKAGQQQQQQQQPPPFPAMIFGRQLGSIKPREFGTSRGPTRFLHDTASFQKLWDEVGAKTGTRWRVHVHVLADLPAEFRIPTFGEDSKVTRFVVYRIED